MDFAESAMAERCVSNSLVQLIMVDRWLDQYDYDLPASVRLLRRGFDANVPHLTNCAFGTTCLSQDPLGITILELVNVQN